MNETAYRADLEPTFGGQRILVMERTEGDLKFRVLPFGASDIDGTIPEEHTPEKDKIFQVDDARTAFSFYEQSGIPMWLTTSRTLGEVELYQQALSIHGGAIFEEGIGIELPDGADAARILQRTNGGFIARHNNKNLLIRGPQHGIVIIRDVFGAVERKTSPLVSSLVYNADNFSDMNEEKLALLAQTAGHHSREAAIASTIRFASAYVAKPSDEQRKLLKVLVGENPSLRMRDHGHVIEVYASHENKGTALSLIAQNPGLFYPNLYINSLYLIVFGNKQNDLEMLKFVKDGIGVLVAGPNPGEYFLSSDELASLPEGTIVTHEVAGKGLIEAVPLVRAKFKDHFGVDMSSDLMTE